MTIQALESRVTCTILSESEYSVRVLPHTIDGIPITAKRGQSNAIAEIQCFPKSVATIAKRGNHFKSQHDTLHVQTWHLRAKGLIK